MGALLRVTMAVTWPAYIRFADVEVDVNKAKTLGGYVLMEPTAAICNGTAAVITDPSGAVFVLQEWNN
jgi:predicted enzyme related to lactoylglutathione lyase